MSEIDDPDASVPEALWPPELYDLLPLTLDQLRSYLAVCKKRSVRQGGQLLSREQTSIEKQVRTVEDRFRKLARGSLLIRPTHRGAEIRLTEAGELVRQFAEKILQEVSLTTSTIRKSQADRPIKIALTKFMVPLLSEIQPVVVERLHRVGSKLNRELIHVRTSHLQTVVKSGEVDFSLGSFVEQHSAKTNLDEELEFVEWERDSVGLIANHRLGFDSISPNVMLSQKLPLIVPRQGLINDLLTIWFGKEGIEGGLNVVEWCDDVYFALDLLILNVYQASMISTANIMGIMKERPQTEHLRFHEITDTDCYVRVGLIRRKGEREAYHRTHPLSIFWNVFDELAGRKNQRTHH